MAAWQQKSAIKMWLQSLLQSAHSYLKYFKRKRFPLRDSQYWTSLPSKVVLTCNRSPKVLELRFKPRNSYFGANFYWRYSYRYRNLHTMKSECLPENMFLWRVLIKAREWLRSSDPIFDHFLWHSVWLAINSFLLLSIGLWAWVFDAATKYGPQERHAAFLFSDYAG